MRAQRISGICGHRNTLSSIDFQPHSEHRESHRLATAGGPVVMIWALSRTSGTNNLRWHCVYSNSSHSPYDVTLVRFSFDGRLLLSVSTRGSVLVMKLRHPAPTPDATSTATNAATVAATDYTPRESWLVLDELVWPSEIGQVADASWAPDNRSVAGGGSSGVAVLDIYTRQVVALFGHHAQPTSPTADAPLGPGAADPPGSSQSAGSPQGGGGTIEGVKSLAWDPMTIFISVTSSNGFSLWRRGKNESADSSYKWSFTLEKWVSVFSLCQSLPCRPSWCPRGRMVAVPMGGGEAPGAVPGGLTMGCSVYLVDKPESGSRVGEQPLNFLGHLNKVTNARFSCDIIKCDESVGGAKAALFAQTSDDGVLSVWRAGFDGRAQCFLAMSSLLDEQVAVSDIAWGNRGSWLAIAQSCGGLILLEFTREDACATFYTNWMRGRRVPDTPPPQVEAPCASERAGKHDAARAGQRPEDGGWPVYFETVTCLMALSGRATDHATNRASTLAPESDDEMAWLDMDSSQPISSISQSQKISTASQSSAVYQYALVHPSPVQPCAISAGGRTQDKKNKRGKGVGLPGTGDAENAVHAPISDSSIAIAGGGAVTVMRRGGIVWTPAFTINLGKKVLMLASDNGYLAIVTAGGGVSEVTVVRDDTGEVMVTARLPDEAVSEYSILRARITAHSLTIAIFSRGRSFAVFRLASGAMEKIVDLSAAHREFLGRVTGFALVTLAQGSEGGGDRGELVTCVFRTDDGRVHLYPGGAGVRFGPRAAPLDLGKVETPAPGDKARLFSICTEKAANPSLMAIAACLLGNAAEFACWYSSLLSQLAKEGRAEAFARAVAALFKSKVLRASEPAFPDAAGAAVAEVLDCNLGNPVYRPFILRLPLDLERMAQDFVLPLLRGELGVPILPEPISQGLLSNIPLWIREAQL